MRGLTLPTIEGMELWEIAAALGVHRIETRAEHDDREIVAKSAAYFEETQAQRMALMAERQERKREQALERRQQRRTVG